MSEAALNHYQAVGESVGITPPDILLGEPVVLLSPSDPCTIALHNPSSSVAEVVAQRYKAVIDTAAQFVLDAARSQVIGEVLVSPLLFRRPAAMTAVTAHLKPPALKTGRIEAVVAEAITPEEVPYEALANFRADVRERIKAALGDVAAHPVCFVTSAEVVSGGRRGVTNGIAIIAAEAGKNGRAVTYFGEGLKDNNDFGRRVLAGSVSTARAVEALGLSTPVQQHRTHASFDYRPLL